MRLPITLCCLVAFAWAPLLHAQSVRKAEDPKVKTAVDSALRFLERLQEKDGAWHSGGQGHPAISSLSVLAFLSAGHVPGEGPYGEVVEKGIRWVVKTQGAEGVFSRHFHEDMYNQGICTLMLAEAVGMTGAELGKEVRQALTKGVRVLLKAQRTEGGYKGGWRYSISGDDADLSVSGWQLMALRAARNAGCDVPAERIDLAIDFVLRCREPATGAFCYQPGRQPTLACTGTGLLALELSGKMRHKSPEALKAGSYLLKNPPRWNSEHCLYTLYYSSQGMFQLGQNYWEAYRPHVHKTLLDNQQDNGSWLGNEGALGPAYPTAMGILALTVENRFLPIYQRDEEEGKKDAK